MFTIFGGGPHHVALIMYVAMAAVFIAASPLKCAVEAMRRHAELRQQQANVTYFPGCMPTPTASPEFPRDLGGHMKQNVELFWYLGNLHANDDPTHQFGVEVSMFRQGTACKSWADSTYIVVIAVSNDRDRIYTFNTTIIPAGDQHAASDMLFDADPYDISVGNMRASAEKRPHAAQESIVRLQGGAIEGNVYVDLELSMRPGTPDALRNSLMGRNGHDWTSSTTHILHVSQSALDAKGTIMVAISQEHDRKVAQRNEVSVSGSIWLQHIWGYVDTPANPWNWYCAHLDNGYAFEATLFYCNGSSNTDPIFCDFSSGNIIAPNGSVAFIPLADINVVTDLSSIWTSANTGVAYTTRHTIFIPSRQMKLTFQTNIPDNEVHIGPLPLFYEAASSVEGFLAGEAVKGRGFTEFRGALVPTSGTGQV